MRQSCRIRRAIASASGLQQASIIEREKPLVAKHHVVKHADAEHIAGFFQAARDLNVFWAGRRIAARVIVNENHRSRTQVERQARSLASMN